MARQIKDLLEQQAHSSFIGRQAELKLLRSVLADEGCVVTYIHGIGGIGKSSLLETFSTQIRAPGQLVVRMDCKGVEPSERGFLRALSQAVGGELSTVAEAAHRLGSLASRVVLALDTYEVLRLLDTWLRQTFIPALGDNVRVVIFGREPPVAAWVKSSGWHQLFQSLQLGPLSDEESIDLMKTAGVAHSEAVWVNRLACGHPLALKLAAAAISKRLDLNINEITSRHVIPELTRIYLQDVSDAITRETLYAASTLRRVTRSLLGALLPKFAPQDLFDRLLGLPFVELSSDGLVIHEAVRDVIASSLKAADPGRYRAYRLAAWQQLQREARQADRLEIWRYISDLLYMIEEPIIHEAFFPSRMQSLAVEPALPGDWPAILRITQKHEGPEATGHTQRLWDNLPTAFRVMRDRNHAVAGYCIFLEPLKVDPKILAAHPILSAWWDHLHRDPLPKNQTALFFPRWLADDEGEAPSAVQAASWLDIKGLYVEHRNTLRRCYCSANDAQGYAPILLKLKFSMVPEDAQVIDGKVYHSAVLDLGPALFEGWLAGHMRSEMGVDQDEILDFDARELIVDGKHIALTPLEFGVMVYLYDRAGKAVERSTLLDSVWGYQYDGGSNVVDARIRSLRKKLGQSAGMIETVSGVGYRFRRA